MEHTKGFITVATGNEEYHRLARNLLRSYRYFCRNPLPFAILTDRENEFTAEFDDVLLFPNGASHSYLDKLSLGDYLPYDDNIFIDADCLAFGDLNWLFEVFREAEDFSCFGRVLPLEDKTGWFEYENLGEWKNCVSYGVGLHGGIYYMRKGALCRKVFETAKALVPDYRKFQFKGNFQTPGDEPLVALSMAVNGCHPIPFVKGAIDCYWEYGERGGIDITKGEARTPQGRTILLHWGTRCTHQLEYQKQVELLSLLEAGNGKMKIAGCKFKYHCLMADRRVYTLAIRAANKIKRILGTQ